MRHTGKPLPQYPDSRKVGNRVPETKKLEKEKEASFFCKRNETEEKEKAGTEFPFFLWLQWIYGLSVSRKLVAT